MTRYVRLAALCAVLVLLLGSAILAQQTTPTEIPPEAAAGLAIGMLIFTIVAIVVGLVVQIIIIVFLYKDATRRGQSGALWAILGFFFGLLALIIWLITRPKT